MERFELSQSIATNCGASHNSSVGGPAYWSKSTCGWKIDDSIIVWVEQPVCQIPADEDADGWGVCYNNPDGGNIIFGS